MTYPVTNCPQCGSEYYDYDDDTAAVTFSCSNSFCYEDYDELLEGVRHAL